MANLEKTYQYAGGQAVTQNRVLRNTYWLLSLSMVPTVLGAAAGMTFGIPMPGGFLGALLFLGIAFGFMWAIEKNKHSGAGVALLLGFTFFMGLMLTPLLMRTLSFANGGTLVMLAAGGTGAIFAVLASIATVSKRDFSGVAKFAFIGLVLIILASLANIFFQIPALSLTISVLAIGIFSAFILYDVQRIVNGGETNYISATLALYLDVYNIFTSLLSILGFTSGDRE
ncbi:Bax inhibitor-1/YccA family protein [Pseudoduganella albidiflava]|uniref:BAX inhibitor protein n=1 Tax=Pseudoduganella albidiflava TaxID=321983 RepID=A0A411WUL8_9BURK|nr:Bax inhibitor-1/YccA family protein [Pseudoduganella albidiflava]QBI00471.1 Bax inhibitor-1/YccA family protein [Pseudoduganella albidiflava]GGY33053.1 BAX inhibitor protein [Pseudoduganella albidiflava]